MGPNIMALIFFTEIFTEGPRGGQFFFLQGSPKFEIYTTAVVAGVYILLN